LSWDWGGRSFVLETGKIAARPTGVVATYGESRSLRPVVAAKAPRRRRGLPGRTPSITGKYYAAGLHPGGYFKREGPSYRKERWSRA